MRVPLPGFTQDMDGCIPQPGSEDVFRYAGIRLRPPRSILSRPHVVTTYHFAVGFWYTLILSSEPNLGFLSSLLNAPGLWSMTRPRAV